MFWRQLGDVLHANIRREMEDHAYMETRRKELNQCSVLCGSRPGKHLDTGTLQ